MKKSLLYLFMLVCSVSIFMSCSDDDDEVKYPIDTELAGGYVGNLSVNVDGNQMGTTENQKITISQSNKGTNQIALSLKNFTFLVNVGDIEVDPCTVKAIDGGYAFEGQQNLDLVQPLGNCPVSISGTVKGSNINIEIGVKVGAPLNQNVKATFVGRKLTGSESSEAKITSFIIDDEAVVEQPVINEEAGTIVFAVNEEVESLKFTPIIEISEGATITPASGVAQDFSNNKKVTYTVTAEDGTVKVYTAFVEGIATSIDDFGTGYSSLNMIKKVDLNVIKIDKSFIPMETEYPGKETDMVMFVSIVDLVRKLGKKTIAEGVETKEQLRYLRQVGCDIVQGYVFDKPMPESEFEVRLEQGYKDEE